jgi:hypothetical protein
MRANILLTTAAALTAVAATAACGPERVSESNPSVTYNYRSEQELVQATRRAEDYCRQFGSRPRQSTTTAPVASDGARTVVFTCTKT